jgi:hypothetical protein
MPDSKQVLSDLRSLGATQTKQAMIDMASELPMEARKEIVEALGGTLPPPAPHTLNLLWTIVVGAFVLVMVGSATILACCVFKAPAENGVKPEIILSLFTSVVGFLAGLFVPSPSRNGGGGSQAGG